MRPSAPIVAVTVLEDRASVTRRGTAHLAAGQHRLVIEGVSPVLADKSLTATASGARVLDVRCERALAPWKDPAGGSVVAAVMLRMERQALEAKREQLDATAAAARVESEGLRQLAVAAHRDLAIAASRGNASPDAAVQLAELDAADRDARGRLVDAELESQSLAAAMARLDARIRTAEAEAGEETARIIVDVIADAANDVTLTIGYVVPGAAWRPYHRAVLARAAGRVDWTTTACVWQATGEDWSDVELICGLERPSLGVEPPDLFDDEVRARKRPDSVVVEMREQEQQTTGLGTGGPLQVPGIDDGGLGLTLSAPRTSIKSDGLPHRVPVGGFTAPAQLSLVAIPLKSPWVHIRARIVNVGQAPLLAGPVDLIMASGYVGRAEVGFVAAGEKFYLGFGPESEIRVHRTETRERDEAGMLGGWNVQTVRVAVRLSNLGTERREIDVTERIPISEVEQVGVQISSPDAYLLGTDDQPGGEEVTQVTARALDERGLVTWGVELPPLGRRAVTLEYKLKSQRGVSTPGL
ncbi:MAG: mucoidy inhibitor MuiA family protein [Deltaproteobacteria bacterium]|nr:mucoidy inhibitor MuiA family protein [Deltaproteobacteria bacterium]